MNLTLYIHLGFATICALRYFFFRVKTTIGGNYKSLQYTFHVRYSKYVPTGLALFNAQNTRKYIYNIKIPYKMCYLHNFLLSQ